MRYKWHQSHCPNSAEGDKPSQTCFVLLLRGHPYVTEEANHWMCSHYQMYFHHWLLHYLTKRFLFKANNVVAENVLSWNVKRIHFCFHGFTLYGSDWQATGLINSPLFHINDVLIPWSPDCLLAYHILFVMWESTLSPQEFSIPSQFIFIMETSATVFCIKEEKPRCWMYIFYTILIRLVAVRFIKGKAKCEGFIDFCKYQLNPDTLCYMHITIRHTQTTKHRRWLFKGHN